MKQSEVAKTLGVVISSFPGGGEARTGQVEMAEAVARAFRTGRHLVVRAGTGTGKSLAYLVPVVVSGKKVVISTATRALQDQLFQKDLPALANATSRPLRYAVLKGRSNYVCVQRLKEAVELADNESLFEGSSAKESSSELGEQAQRVRAWAETTTTGDRAELASEVDQRVWAGFSTSAEECPGPYRCPSGGQCFAERAHDEAEKADVVVVNLHLLGADVASHHGLLPDYDCLVIDEAHETEDVMSAALGITLSPGRFRQAAQVARGARARDARLGRAADDLVDAAQRFESELLAHTGARVAPESEGELFVTLALLRARLDRLVAELGAALEDTSSLTPRVARAQLLVGRLAEQAGRAAAPGAQDVTWVSESGEASFELAPIDVAPMLSNELFLRGPVVLTSATVPLGLGRSLGAEVEATDAVEVESPFAYDERALLYCAAHLPDRRRPESDALAYDEIEALITAAGGRTLALFTSHRALREATKQLRSRIELPILAQGEGSKAALLERFAKDIETSLFATLSFWQGVDVPGETLSLVVIDRLPFSRPDDPLLAARREAAGASAFRQIDLPRAASLLAQGAGRLVRSRSDRGVVAVLDSRLANASYRWELVRALPPMRRTKDREQAEAFLRCIAAGDQ